MFLFNCVISYTEKAMEHDKMMMLRECANI